MSEAEFKLRIALRAAEKSKIIQRRDFIQLASLARFDLWHGKHNVFASLARSA